MTLTPYKYTPLNAGQMRLLRPIIDGDNVKWSLETSPMPSGSSSSVSGSMGHALSSQAPWKDVFLNDPESTDRIYKSTFGVESYYALSYAWGDLTAQTNSLLCDGQELKIHRNLHEALPHLAQRFPNKPVWVDAICINQLDSQEKQIQIPFMNRIYGAAKRVVVWLGKPDDKFNDDLVAEAMALLPRLASIGEDKALKGIWRGMLDKASVHEALTKFQLPPLSAPVWSSIFHMVCSPWFGRLWVVQEFVLAEDVSFLYGHNVIDKDTMEKLWEPQHVPILKMISKVVAGRAAEREALEMRSGIFMLKDIFATVDFIANDPQMGQKGDRRHQLYAQYLNMIVNFTAGRSCYDPRDRVFGVLGIVGDQLLGASILRRLTYECPLAELFTYFFGFISIHTGLPPNFWHCLQQATRMDKMSGLPSWCPDLTRPPRLEFHEFMDTSESDTQEPQPVPWNEDRPRELVLRGAVLDSVAVVHPVPMECEELKVLDSRDMTFVEELLLTAKIATWEEKAVAGILNHDHGTKAVFGDKICDVPQASLNEFWKTLLGSWWQLEYEKHAYPDITLKDYNEIRVLLRRVRNLVDREEGWLRQLVETGIDEPNAVNGAAKEHLGRDDQQIVEQFYLVNQDSLKRVRPLSRFAAFCCAVCLCAADRKIRPITTSQGRLGLGPYSAMKGDALCVFTKSLSPHLLRLSTSPGSAAEWAQEEGDNKVRRYMLIGEAIYNLSEEDNLAIGDNFQDIILI